jgi:hypothetical protein
VTISGGTLGVLIKIVFTIVTLSGLTLRRLVVVPYAEPITLELAKTQCKVELDQTDEDELISGYIIAARRFVEERTGHVLVRRPMTESFAGFPHHGHHGQGSGFGSMHHQVRPIELWKTPIVSVGDISYLDDADADQVYSTAMARLGTVPARIYPASGECWPAASCRGEVTVPFVAGYDEGEAPIELTQAMLMLIASWYKIREAVDVGNRVATIPLGVEHLCDSVRLPRIG